MNLIEIKGNWNEQKGKIMQRFAVHTDNYSMFAKGKEEKMLGRHQIKLGKSKNAIYKITAVL